MRRATYVVGVLALLAGLGGSAAPAIGSTAAPVTKPISAGWAEEQHTITLQRGQLLRVTLTGQTCTATSTPTSAGAPVLRVRSVGGSGGMSWAVFQAQAAGSTVVTATQGESCGLGGSDFVPQKYSLTVRVR